MRVEDEFQEEDESVVCSSICVYHRDRQIFFPSKTSKRQQLDQCSILAKLDSILLVEILLEDYFWGRFCCFLRLMKNISYNFIVQNGMYQIQMSSMMSPNALTVTFWRSSLSDFEDRLIFSFSLSSPSSVFGEANFFFFLLNKLCHILSMVSIFSVLINTKRGITEESQVSYRAGQGSHLLCCLPPACFRHSDCVNIAASPQWCIVDRRSKWGLQFKVFPIKNLFSAIVTLLDKSFSFKMTNWNNM